MNLAKQPFCFTGQLVAQHILRAMLVFFHEAHVGKDAVESGIGIEVLHGRIGNDIASRA